MKRTIKSKKKGLNKRPAKSINQRYLMLLETDSVQKFKEFGELISKKKLKWVYHKIENSVGVHYYKILKK